MKKKKLNLEELQVESFVTSLSIINSQTPEIRGGTLNDGVCALSQGICSVFARYIPAASVGLAGSAAAGSYGTPALASATGIGIVSGIVSGLYDCIFGLGGKISGAISNRAYGNPQ